MPTKRMWLGHAPDVPQIDQVEFDETAATVLAEGTDLIFEVNGKELLVENPHPLEDDDTTQAGDTSAVLTLLQLAEAAINGSQIPEFAELEASVESPDTDPESPYHRLSVTTREQYHGWPFSLAVKAPNPTVDIDVVQKGAPGQNEKQSYFITPTPTGGSHRIKWNLGGGLETSGTIPAGADADDVKAAMITGMPTITEDNVIVIGSNMAADPFLIELTDDLAETDFPKLSVDVASLTGNGEVTISTIQNGGSSGGGSNLVNDTFTVGVDTLLSAHTSDTAHTWTVTGRDGKIFEVLDRVEFGRTDSPGSGTTLARSSLSSDSDVEITATFFNVLDDLNYPGLLFRFSDTSNYLYGGFQVDHDTNTLRMAIVKVESSVPTALASQNVNSFGQVEFDLKVVAAGSSITFEVTPFGQTAQSLSVESSFNQTATAHGFISPDHFRTAFWLCRCQCGNTTAVDGNKLRNGHTQSCGCLQKERTSAHRKTHGMSHTATYQVWCGMIKRCENPRSKGFSNYGGRGIKVCERWRNSFEVFLEDMGPRPSSRHSIDRINSDGDYEPGNCRWATAKQQARNLRTNRLLTCRGQSKTLAEWAEERRIHSSTITRRIDVYGWSEEEAILTPLTGAGRG